MRRLSKALATASLLVALTTSSVYAVPSSSDAGTSFGSKIIRIIRHVVGLDLGDLSWPHP
jgi:hypothetical protein